MSPQNPTAHSHILSIIFLLVGEFALCYSYYCISSALHGLSLLSHHSSFVVFIRVAQIVALVIFALGIELSFIKNHTCRVISQAIFGSLGMLAFGSAIYIGISVLAFSQSYEKLFDKDNFPNVVPPLRCCSWMSYNTFPNGTSCHYSMTCKTLIEMGMNTALVSSTVGSVLSGLVFIGAFIFSLKNPFLSGHVPLKTL